MASVLQDVIAKNTLVSHFQPIVSVRKKRSVGAEALARAKDAQSGNAISPLQLFRWAEEERLTLELDRLCRKTAMKSFRGLLNQDPSLLLFVNFEVSVLDDGVLGSGSLEAVTYEANLKPENVVIEINESKVKDLETLQHFVERHKELGFLVALDDLGAGHSNLQRLSALKPDILKLDRSLIMGLGGDFFKREIFKSLVNLAHNIGALVLAEGVETEDEVSTSLGLGADLFQGFYFSRPHPVEEWKQGNVKEIIDSCAEHNREAVVKDMMQRREESQKYRGLLIDAVGRISGENADFFDVLLGTMATRNENLESVYVLDAQGIQRTATITGKTKKMRSRGSLFQPAAAGTDHSMRDYFYGLMDAGLSRFISEPYISLASGHLCRTLSCTFKDQEGKTFVLCLDVAFG